MEGRRLNGWAVAVAGSLVTATLAVGPAAAHATAAGTSQCRPAIRILPALPGSGASQVGDFGAGSLAAGASGGRPVYWSGGRVHRVPLPAGYTRGAVEAVNRSGLMVGGLSATSAPGAASAAFSYRPGDGAVRLLPGGTRATGVNDHGHIVGEGTADGVPAGFEWVGGRLRRVLSAAPGYVVTTVTAINNSGQITGSARRDTDAPLVWSSDPAALPAVLDGYGPEDTESTWAATAIDENGRIAGTTYYARADLTSPVTWAARDAEYHYVPLLGERTSGVLEDVSPTTGIMVGTALDSYVVGPFPPETAPPVQAQIWPGTGPMLALPRLAPDGPSQAHAVTDDGRVGGSAADASGVVRAVVWTCALRQAYQPGTA